MILAGVEITEQHIARFWSRVELIPFCTCWIWTGARGQSGHGQFFLRKHVSVPAHRFAWSLANGPIPDGLLGCHHCDNPPCVRPSHIFIGTQLENIADCIRKGRHWKVGMTHCHRGHLLAAGNVVNLPDGYRACRTCKRARQNRWTLARRTQAAVAP